MRYVKVTFFALCLSILACEEDTDTSLTITQVDTSPPVDSAGSMSTTGGEARPDQGAGGMMNAGSMMDPIMDAGGMMDLMMEDPPTPGSWELVWQDEFEGAEINQDYWSHEVNCWGGGNNEDQCYVSDAKNSFIQDGSLHIVALKDRPSGAVGGPGNDQNVVTKGHSSARMVTQGKVDWKYGRIEASMKIPCGQGLWPAFWMMPATSEYGGWAASGEIDIMEAVNLDCDANQHEVHGTLHYGASSPNNIYSGTHAMTQGSAVNTFHTYAVEWEPGEIRWFLDGVHFATQSNWCTESAPFPAPFDQSFFIILNVAVGGAWPGPPNDTTTFPQRMEVDYIRVYQCPEGEECGSSQGLLERTP